MFELDGKKQSNALLEQMERGVTRPGVGALFNSRAGLDYLERDDRIAQLWNNALAVFDGTTKYYYLEL